MAITFLHTLFYFSIVIIAVILLINLERYIINSGSTFTTQTFSNRDVVSKPTPYFTAFKVALLATCFSVLPLGDYSLAITELHPDLVNFQVLAIASPEQGLLVPFVVGFFYLLAKSMSDCFSNNRDRRSVIFNISIGLLFFVLFLGLFATNYTTSFQEAVTDQAELGWTIYNQPVGAFLFLISLYIIIPLPGTISQKNDLQQTFVRGGLILFLSAVFVNLYFGGWVSPFENYNFAQTLFDSPLVNSFRSLVWFGLKTFLLIYLLFQLKLFLPKLRFDQLLRGIWGVLIPISVINYFITVISSIYIKPGSSQWIFIQSGWLIIFLIIFWRLTPPKQVHTTE